MSKWTHYMCDSCWRHRHKVRLPVKISGQEPDECCYCHTYTRHGQYVREDPMRTCTHD